MDKFCGMTQSHPSSFWKNKRVLITGHTGFKGSWLSLLLLRYGANVAGFSDGLPSKPSLFDALSLQKSLYHITGDVRDLDCLKKAVKTSSPEIIFHMAAQSLVKRSYDDAVGTYSTNVMGTVNVLEALRCHHSARALVCVTSDKCYSLQDSFKAYEEHDRLGGDDPYSSSKACSELVVNAYVKSYFKEGSENSIGVATARAGNVIGGGDWAEDRLIPDIIRDWAKGQTTLLRYPSAIRPWQHILEALSGYCLLAEHLYQRKSLFEGAWNFGPHSSSHKSVNEVCDLLLKHLPEMKFAQRISPGIQESLNLRLNSSKSQENLFWTPMWNFQTTISKTALWYRDFLQGHPAMSLCERDLKDYEKCVEQKIEREVHGIQV